MGPGSRALCMMPDRDLTRLEGLAADRLDVY